MEDEKPPATRRRSPTFPREKVGRARPAFLRTGDAPERLERVARQPPTPDARTCTPKMLGGYLLDAWASSNTTAS